MFSIIHKDTKAVYKVYGIDTDIEGEHIWFLIFKAGKWEWLDAKECVPSEL